MIDYLVVGLGLAGLSFCEVLEQNKKSFVVINDRSQQASKVAAGLYNPIILKRFSLAWKADEQLSEMLPFYKKLEKKLEINCVEKLQVLRRFASIEEQNSWFEAADKNTLRPFLSTEILSNTNFGIKAPFGYGEVLGTGKIKVAKMLSSYEQYLSQDNKLRIEPFNFSLLKIDKEVCYYDGIKAKQIVFAEGFGMKNNPFFNYLPLTSTKGEYLFIKAVELKLQSVIKAGLFVIPEGDDTYRVGATYKWKDQSNEPTEASRTEIQEKLEAFLRCDYQILDQVAGIRPTVTDRRPLVGKHPTQANIYLLNGFGSRGVMIAPWAATRLYTYIEEQKVLEKEMDCSRFTRKYFQK